MQVAEGILISLGVVIVVVLYSFYSTAHKTKCFVSEKSKNSRIYDQDEAVCFVYQKLKGRYSMKDINWVLTKEFEYMQKKGLVGQDTASAMYVDPLPYILKQTDRKLSEDEILDILIVEEDYMKFVGIIQSEKQ